MRIALLGDIALIGCYDRTIDANVEKRVEYIRQIVSACDYVIANQESVLTDRVKTRACKGAYLRSDVQNVETLKYLGITHVTLANNHIYDYEKKGAEDTIRALTEAGIEYVGLNGDPIILSDGNSKVMIDGFCCLSANALNYGEKVGQVKMLTKDNLVQYLSLAKSKDCFPIASVHYGIEGVHYPSAEHLKLFRELANEFTYVLHGNHPHAMQGYEKIGDSLLIYAQGNLCFDDITETSIHDICKQTDEKQKGYVVLLDIDNNQLIDYHVQIVTDLNDGMLKNGDDFLLELERYSDDLHLSVNEICDKRRIELCKAYDTGNRDIHFFLKRINRKYIGAYINGRRHAKLYKKVFSQYL